MATAVNQLVVARDAGKRRQFGLPTLRTFIRARSYSRPRMGLQQKRRAADRSWVLLSVNTTTAPVLTVTSTAKCIRKGRSNFRLARAMPRRQSLVTPPMRSTTLMWTTRPRTIPVSETFRDSFPHRKSKSRSKSANNVVGNLLAVCRCRARSDKHNRRLSDVIQHSKGDCREAWHHREVRSRLFHRDPTFPINHHKNSVHR